ncbi:hypothetical protein GUITHDRAFT_151502 [Guillardia theta CCMP2712]|uniref:Transcription elongation factor 1 homolog n=1 Tax=Guillardia theta (strain CCMP2712) TaxID=905079 RepID=L1JLS2_GUITC|nr:hypothetical protein GUITHDRAFT_151502 [Guillardia theta CCMP2712]EKX49297.1 hypothetical protein GUITHDRAFT_151502 [Guillardia theta CCMP2712]|eukprot:XP_005836277.1 hypothetical protein GUITHDRAFT_151502 [Guillardia theta CCMP2712]
MGKRKSAKKVQKKERPKVMSKFDCPFCNHEGCIRIAIIKKAKLATVKCTTCGQDWATTVTALTEPIDVFCEWIDACEKKNQEAPSHGHGGASSSARPRDEDKDDEDEDEDDD